MKFSKIFSWLAPLLIMSSLLFSMSGCENIKTWIDSQDKNMALKTVVYTAVDALIEKNPEYRDKILDLTGDAKQFIDSNPKAQASEIIAAARKDINWDKLNNNQKVIAETLLSVLEDQIKQQIDEGKLEGLNSTRVLDLIGWVEDAARVTGMGAELNLDKTTDNKLFAKVSTCKVTNSILLGDLSPGVLAKDIFEDTFNKALALQQPRLNYLLV